ARQVDQATLIIQPEEVQQLGAARGFRGARQAGVGQGVQRTGLARIGAAGESDFQSLVSRALVDLGGADHECGMLAEDKKRVFREHDGSDGALGYSMWSGRRNVTRGSTGQWFISVSRWPVYNAADFVCALA